jgi:sugar lactone lactonase YvrE
MGLGHYPQREVLMGTRWLLVGPVVMVSLALPPMAANSTALPQKQKPAAGFAPGKGDRVLFRGKPDEVCGVAISPDGKLVAAGGNQVVRLWSLETGKEVRRLQGHAGFINAVAFSPDGKSLASAGDETETVALLWDVASGKKLGPIGRHADRLYTVDFSPDGRTLVTSGFDEHIGLWDVATGKQLHYFAAHPRVPYGIAFSPDGRTLASGGDRDGTIRLWDVATGKVVRQWEGHGGSVPSVAFSPDGRLLASGGGDGKVRLWEMATGKEVYCLEEAEAFVIQVAFAPDGQTLVAANYGGTVGLWESMTGKQLRRFGNHDRVWGVAYAPSGRVVASVGSEGTVVLWDLSAALAGRHRAVGLTAAELDGAWSGLAGADAARALTAARALAATPAAQVTPFLRERLRPPPPRVAAAQVGLLIRGLDEKTFRSREAASRALEALGHEAGPELRQALARPASLEQRQRLEALVAKLDAQGIPLERLRAVRALRVLEDLGTPAAHKQLQELAGGEPYDLVTREATAALARLAKRPATAP